MDRAALMEALRPGLSLAGPALVAAGLALQVDAVAILVATGAAITVLDGALPDRVGVDRADGPWAARVALWMPRLHLAMHAVLLVACCSAWGTATAWGRLSLALGFGFYACAFGINVAHELVHRRSRVDRALGGLTLALVCYGTFKIEHVRGHHRWVATDRDPSSAPLGRGVYAHVVQAIPGTVREAWRIERRRLQSSGRSVWSVHNEVLGWTAVSVAAGAALGAVFGWSGVACFGAQSLVAVATLELANYVEHYGLRRAPDASGRLPAVGAAHSWSSPALLSNALFFNVQRHAHHHARPGVPYHLLQHWSDAPQLPAGHPVMMALALVPPLWRRVMDPRVAALSRAADRHVPHRQSQLAAQAPALEQPAHALDPQRAELLASPQHVQVQGGRAHLELLAQVLGVRPTALGVRLVRGLVRQPHARQLQQQEVVHARAQGVARRPDDGHGVDVLFVLADREVQPQGLDGLGRGPRPRARHVVGG